MIIKKQTNRKILAATSMDDTNNVDNAKEYIRLAIDALCEPAKSSENCQEAIANLCVILFDL